MVTWATFFLCLLTVYYSVSYHVECGIKLVEYEIGSCEPDD